MFKRLVKKFICEKLEKKTKLIDSLEFVFPPSDHSQNANVIKLWETGVCEASAAY